LVVGSARNLLDCGRAPQSARARLCGDRPGANPRRGAVTGRVDRPAHISLSRATWAHSSMTLKYRATASAPTTNGCGSPALRPGSILILVTALSNSEWFDIRTVALAAAARAAILRWEPI